jgi:hypothetical protein
LKEFYSGEGKDRPVRISIPKGGYAPEFMRVSGSESVTPAVQVSSKIPAAEASLQPAFRRKIWIALGAASLALNCLLLVQWLIPLEVSARASAQMQRYAPYRELFGAGNAAPREALICLSNPQVFLLDQDPKPPANIPPGPLALTSDMRRVLGRSARPIRLGRCFPPRTNTPVRERPPLPMRSGVSPSVLMCPANYRKRDFSIGTERARRI